MGGFDSAARLQQGTMSYNLRFKSRGLASLPANADDDEQQIRFLVGTTNLREDNELHVIEYSEASNEVSCLCVLNHPNEIWSISPCPADPSLTFTTYSQGGKFGVSLWTPSRSAAIRKLICTNAFESKLHLLPCGQCFGILRSMRGTKDPCAPYRLRVIM